MKRYYYILLAVLCSGACKANTPKDDKDSLLKQNIVRNKVHFIQAYEYEYKSGAVDSTTRFLANSDEYDSKGNLIAHLDYPRKDSTAYHPIDSTTNSFDLNGNLLKKTQIKYVFAKGSSQSFIHHIKVFENVYVDNKRTESTIHIDGKLDSKVEYKWNSDGKFSEYISYDKNGGLISRNLNIYVNGENTGATTFDQNDRIIYRSEIVKKDKYHILTTVYKGADKVLSVREQELDAKGQTIVDKFKMESFYITNKYTYNDWGALTSNTVYYDGGTKISQYKKFEIVKFK
jgi:hypothetical protein